MNHHLGWMHKDTTMFFEMLKKNDNDDCFQEVNITRERGSTSINKEFRDYCTLSCQGCSTKIKGWKHETINNQWDGEGPRCRVYVTFFVWLTVKNSFNMVKSLLFHKSLSSIVNYDNWLIPPSYHKTCHFLGEESGKSGQDVLKEIHKIVEKDRAHLYGWWLELSYIIDFLWKNLFYLN